MTDGRPAERLVALIDVQRLVLDACRPLPAVPTPLDEALGRVLAEDVAAADDLPPFANSAMDGYAVRAADTAGAPVELEVVAVVAAGAVAERAVGPGEAIQIMTGAPFPDGADGIAIVEVTEPGTAPSTVRVLEPVTAHEFVRAAGSDLRRGAVALAAGTVLGPAQLGTLASVGSATVPVHRLPTVGVLSTGDELVDPSEPLEPGQIRDANRHSLLAALRRDGFPTVDLGVARDEEPAIFAALAAGVERCDAVLTSGGVSMGEFDYVKVALDRLVDARGGAIHQLKVAIRPAKPLSFAVVGRPERPGLPAVPVFGLPGNPVSSLVSYQVIALPALRRLAGRRDPLPHALPALATETFSRRRDGKLHLLRVVAAMGPDGRIIVRSAGGQNSHQLAALAAANALALVPDGDGIGLGETVEILLLSELG